jgi:peptidylprolyl isomerase
MLRSSALPLIAVALLFAACGDSKPASKTAAATPTATATATPYIEKVTGNPTPYPEVPPSGRKEPEIKGRAGGPPAKLVVRDIQPGDGAVIKVGDLLTLDYKGAFYETGKPFDSSWSRGRPFHFIFGSRQVIKGWDQGMKGMRVGGRRELTIPPELAYGDHGQGSIPPNATLVFVVDLLDARKA